MHRHILIPLLVLAACEPTAEPTVRGPGADITVGTVVVPCEEGAVVSYDLPSEPVTWSAEVGYGPRSQITWEPMQPRDRTDDWPQWPSQDNPWEAPLYRVDTTLVATCGYPKESIGVGGPLIDGVRVGTATRVRFAWIAAD